MKSITDQRDSVLELQGWLQALHNASGGDIPLVNSDGIYGSETTAAVRRFQELFGLPVTGDVDLATWNAIRDAALLAERAKNPKPLNIFPPNYQTVQGERSDTVAIIQFILRTLADLYGGLESRTPSGVYDENTASDIRKLQKYHGLPQTGIVDTRTWDALANAYNISLGSDGGEGTKGTRLF